MASEASASSAPAVAVVDREFVLDGADSPRTPSKGGDHPVQRLPAEFFQPLETFDAVQHMLDSLPDRLSEAFLQAQTQQTQVVLDSINSQLSARVMRSYGAFVHGMAQARPPRPAPASAAALSAPPVARRAGAAA